MKGERKGKSYEERPEGEGNGRGWGGSYNVQYRAVSLRSLNSGCASD